MSRDRRPAFVVSASAFLPRVGPTLYRALLRLRAAGLIRAAKPPEPDAEERREYWDATAAGRRALEAALARMESFLTVGRARTSKSTSGGGK